MPMELELGMLISKLNPYDVDINMHLAPGDPESIKGVLDQEIFRPLRTLRLRGEFLI